MGRVQAIVNCGCIESHQVGERMEMHCELQGNMNQMLGKVVVVFEKIYHSLGNKLNDTSMSGCCRVSGVTEHANEQTPSIGCCTPGHTPYRVLNTSMS